jgi:hypothetical protein
MKRTKPGEDRGWRIEDRGVAWVEPREAHRDELCLVGLTVFDPPYI